MQKIFLWLLGGLLFPGIVLQAQQNPTSSTAITHADQLYESFYFLSAIEKYEKSWRKDSSNQETALQLARCYHQLRNAEKTVQWYQRTEQNRSHFTPDDQQAYAQALVSMGKYDEARAWYTLYADQTGNQQMLKEKVSALSNHQAFYQDSAYYTIQPVSINSGQSDFSPVYWEEGIIFVSARGKSSWLKKSYGWNDQPFLDLYYAKNDQGKLAEPIALNKKVNSKYHEGPAAFYQGGQRMIFTRNNYFEGKAGASSQGVTKLQMFTAKRDDDQSLNWDHIQPFPYNNQDYSVGHPSVSADGSRLYFVSDMPGGLGGTDIYVCQWEDSVWGTPHNLGAPINTAGAEMFPFIHEDEVLYFSSDGHAGLGGLDIFRINLSENDVAKVHNLGSPVNSGNDDFGLILDVEGKNGYFSSNRNNNPSDDDLYAFIYTKPKETTINGQVVYIQNQQPLEASMVTVENEDGEVIQSVYADATGHYQFQLPWNQKYNIRAKKEGYTPYEHRIVTDQGHQKLDLPLDFQLRVEGKITDKETGKPLNQVEVLLKDLTLHSEVKISTKQDGLYEFMLEEGHQYQITSSKRKYFLQGKEFASAKSGNRPMKVDVALEEIVLNKAIALEYIYYDLGKWDIRPDAAHGLDKLVKIMQDNPTIEVELSSHTDARGSDQFNLTLSDKRAKAAAAYIVSQGIAKDRIIGKGYGEKKLINQCTNGVNCTEDAHQQNRRTEFAVTSF